MKITNKIVALDAFQTEPKDGKFGKVWYINGRFEDGSLLSKSEKSLAAAQKVYNELEAIIDQVGEFDIKDSGAEYQGNKKVWLNEWPGMTAQPKGGGFGGKRDFVPRYRDTEQGTREERDSIHRSVAIQETTKLICGGKVELPRFRETADQIYGWLVNSPGRTQAPPADQKPAEPPPKAESKSAAADGLACPNCGMQDKKIVREDNKEPGKYYCWKAKGGCGHNFTKLEALQKMTGMTTGSALKTAYDKYCDEITKAIANKNVERINSLSGLIFQSYESGSVSQDEADDLDKKIGEGRAVLMGAEQF